MDEHVPPPSPQYEPTSPTPEQWEQARLDGLLQKFDKVPKRTIKLPNGWERAVTKEAMEEMVCAIALMAESYEALILDVHHGNVPLEAEPPRMGLGLYAKYLQPKNQVDVAMSKLMDQLDKAEAAQAQAAKRPRSV